MTKIKPKLSKLSQWEIVEDDLSIAQNGRKLDYQWSTQKQPDIKLATPNYTITKTEGRDKPLTVKEKEEFKKHIENLKLQAQQQELAERKARIQQSIQAQSQPFSAQNLAIETQAIGDKLRFFPNAPSDSFRGVIDDYLNSFKMIGDMASGLGSVPYNIQQGNYGQAALAVGVPLAIGALAGMGANSVKQFVNNLANPLAGIERPNFLRRNRLQDLPPPPSNNFDISGLTPPEGGWQQIPIEEASVNTNNFYRGSDLNLDRFNNIVENISTIDRNLFYRQYGNLIQNIVLDNQAYTNFLNHSPRVQLKNAITNPKRTLARLQYNYERGALNPKSLYYNQFMNLLPGDKIGGHRLFGNAEKGFREAMKKAAEVNPGRMFGEPNLSSDSFLLLLAQLRRKAKDVNIIHTGNFLPLNNYGNKSRSLLTAAKNSQEGQESILKYINEHIDKLNKETESKIPQAKIIDRKVHIPYILAERKGATLTDKLQRNKTVGLLGTATATLTGIKPLLDYLNDYNQKKFEENYNNWKKNKPYEVFEKYPVQQKQSGGKIKTDPQGYWNPENVGKPVNIPSNRITMKGVNQPLIGISDTGDIQYMQPNGEYLFDGNSVLELPLAQDGIKIPFDDWYKTVNPNYADTTNYRLRDAYNTLPIKTLEAWKANPDKNHLPTVGKIGDNYEFFKSKNHPTIQFELDWYNSPKGKSFRKQYDLDTTGEYYKYTPKMQQGGRVKQNKSKTKSDWEIID